MLGLKARTGILVNEANQTYDIARGDNGKVIATMPMSAHPKNIRKMVEYLEKNYFVNVENKESLYMHLENGLIPELAWRPGHRRGFIRQVQEAWWESGNIVKEIRKRRGDF